MTLINILQYLILLLFVSAPFLPVFCSGDSLLFSKMHNNASYHITVKTWKDGKFYQGQGNS